MKFSMQTLGPVFNTNRMIEEHTKRFYIPTAIEYVKLKKDSFALVKKKTEWIKKIQNNWNSVKFISTSDNISSEMKVASNIAVRSTVYLGSLMTDDVSVQIYSGYLNDKQSVSNPAVDEMYLVSKDGDNYVFEGKVLVDKVGKCGCTIRIVPRYDGEIQYMPGIIKWI